MKDEVNFVTCRVCGRTLNGARPKVLDAPQVGGGLGRDRDDSRELRAAGGGPPSLTQRPAPALEPSAVKGAEEARKEPSVNLVDDPLDSFAC